MMPATSQCFKVMAEFDFMTSLAERATLSVMQLTFKCARATAHHRYPITALGCRFQLKSGRTSAPRLPQALQAKRYLDIGQPDIIGTALRNGSRCF
jgi:hypothetical protein